MLAPIHRAGAAPKSTRKFVRSFASPLYTFPCASMAGTRSARAAPQPTLHAPNPGAAAADNILSRSQIIAPPAGGQPPPPTSVQASLYLLEDAKDRVRAHPCAFVLTRRPNPSYSNCR